jgi:hypothetical protein
MRCIDEVWERAVNDELGRAANPVPARAACNRLRYSAPGTTGPAGCRISAGRSDY